MEHENREKEMNKFVKAIQKLAEIVRGRNRDREKMIKRLTKEERDRQINTETKREA